MDSGRWTRAVALGAALTVFGCSAPVQSPAGIAPPPRGMLFVEGPMAKTQHGWVSYRYVRAYRDGRLVSTYYQRVLPARDRASASLLYDEQARTVRSIRGGRSWPFNPCPDRMGVGSFAELSPSGRAGLCLDAWSNTARGDRLVLFDPRHPNTTRRVLMTSRMDPFHPAAWIDENRIAVTEYRDGRCPDILYMAWPTSLAVIDRTGRVLERGPCVYALFAGPRGLVLENWFKEGGWPADLIAALTFRRHGNVAHFSVDGGQTWRVGRAQFVDGDGRVFYANATNNDDNVLYEGGKPTTLRDPYGATWARP